MGRFIHSFMHPFFKRKEKQKLLFKSDQLLSRPKIEIMKRDCLDKVKSNVSTKLSSNNITLLTVKPAKEPKNNIGESRVQISGAISEGVPDGCQTLPDGSAMFPPAVRVKETRSTPEGFGHSPHVPVSSKPTRCTPTGTKKQPAQPQHAIKQLDTVEAFYTGSDESIEERKQVQQIEQEYAKYKKPIESICVPPSAKASKESNSSIETIEWIEEQVAPPRDDRIIQIRDFCVSEAESEESIIVCPRSGVKKSCEDSSTSETDYEEQEEDDDKSCDILFDDVVNVIHLRNTRVMARFNYNARKAGELNFKKGQIIKQKLGKDEYGFSYGWTRSSKFVHKQYGYYPSEIVTSVRIDDHRLF